MEDNKNTIMPGEVLRYACRDSRMKLDILKKARFDGQNPWNVQSSR